MTEDPFAVLGLAPGATPDELRAARRRLARDVHPDRAGGSAAATAAMQRLNVAFDAAMSQVGAPTTVATDGPPAESADAPPAGSAEPVQTSSPTSSPTAAGPVPRPGGRMAHDVASFTIEALPVEAFEALVVVASWLGEVLDDDPPYRLDTWLGEPYDCWCRLDLVPDAGASTVALTLGTIDGRPAPDLDVVRDTWVAELNTLGRPEDGF